VAGKEKIPQKETFEEFFETQVFIAMNNSLGFFAEAFTIVSEQTSKT